MYYWVEPLVSVRDLENLRVLIVEDNATNRLILHEMLSNRRMRPHEVASARFGRENQKHAGA